MCRVVSLSRQAYYNGRRRRQRQYVDEQLVLSKVREVRKSHACMGTIKLQECLRLAGVEIGRDCLYRLLRENSMLVKRRRSPRTTDSRHSFRVYKNLVGGLDLNHANRAWASDITYINTKEGYQYLALITDMHSRKIVGYAVNDNLEAIGCVKALRMALRQLPKDARLIHHSDRGSQYCSKAYVAQLSRKAIAISMTEENHCYENALAERVNGILKHEYYLKAKFSTKAEARIACMQAIRLYNEERPHRALGLRTPEQVHAKAA